MTVEIRLTYAGTTVFLPEDLHWPDEHAWQSVAQSVRYSLTGKVVREATRKAAARPITLQGAEDAAWMTREDLDTVRGWADIAGAVLVLRLHGVDRFVVFNHDAGPVEAVPLQIFNEPDPADRYVVTLRFLTAVSL